VNKKITIIGGGLAGVEAAYQISQRGINVELFEMRPLVTTEAHQTKFLGEMVCSNSLGSIELNSASGLLKKELEMLNSFFLTRAVKSRVPAGNSLSVDRLRLAEDVTREISSISNISMINREIKEIKDNQNPVIIATGPLTSKNFAQFLTTLTQRKNLFFYDATSPIVDAETIDYSKVFRASRYNKGEADFLNIPLDENQYNNFVTDLINSEKVEIKDFEKGIFFEACLPIEEIAKRGEKSLAFGTLKPVGLKDPSTKKLPYAVVQLRQDDVQENFYQMIGFQTRLKQMEQKKIFRKLPGLEKAKFERYGRMHRNTYINSPLIIDSFLQSKKKKNVFFAGQICGVEGYVESICSGLIAGIFAAKKVLNEPLVCLPKDTAIGALINYICEANWKNFRPTKFTFGLLPEINKNKLSDENLTKSFLKKKKKKEIKAKIAVESLNRWIQQIKI